MGTRGIKIGSEGMSELKKKINYTVACVNEFAGRYHLSSKEAFIYMTIKG